LIVQRQQRVAHEPLFSLSPRALIDLDVLSLKCPIAHAFGCS
jgi:hypothetical protein